MKKRENAKVYIGTSGWSYPHWKENFYPKDVKSDSWLEYYGGVFPTVEINSTFYRTPYASTIQHWSEVVPDNFIFSVKANRYITHQKRLHDCGERMEFFHKTIEGFGEKLGPILFQLPPSFKNNQERLEEFIQLLKKDHLYVFEFRHPTWYVQEIYDLLAKHDIALCITDLNKVLSPEIVTAHFTYIRLHGPKEAYQGTYGPAQLKAWKKRIQKWMSEKTSVYCYFDNDEKGYAVEDAQTLTDFMTKE